MVTSTVVCPTCGSEDFNTCSEVETPCDRQPGKPVAWHCGACGLTASEVEIAAGRGFRFVDRGAIILATFTENPDEPRDDLVDYGFGWSDVLGGWVLLGGASGRLVARSIARSWVEAERAFEADEPPDPGADIIESDEESEAINDALDVAGRWFQVDAGAASVADIVGANAHDAWVIDFIREEILPLAVGQSCTFHGGAHGDTTYRRAA